MQIIIIGGARSGMRSPRRWRPTHELCVVDAEPDVADRFGLLDVEFLTGSGTSRSLLERARVGTCDLLIACTGLDEVNIVACSIGSSWDAVARSPSSPRRTSSTPLKDARA